MVPIQNVLCPVDFSAATARQVAMAAELSRVFGARLILHHNLTTTPLGAGVGWMYASEVSRDFATEDEVETRLKHVIEQLPAGVAASACVTRGMPWTAVVNAAQAEHAQLVVLATHGESNEDHASVTEQVLEEAGSLVLVLHETGDAATPQFTTITGNRQSFLVPTDFSRDAQPALALACDLARRMPIDLHLLYVESARQLGKEPTMAEIDRQRLAALVPDDLKSRVTVHIGTGDPGHEIAAAAERLGVACIVMGEHARTPFRRWFTHNTSRDVLHFAHCPIWYVPGTMTDTSPERALSVGA
ncbi:MAG: universal stress protein [Acidobacteria bacterium]|nr:universal stress protein [Acidobacteriota bacterium]